jgi:hypothetical protein
LPYSSGGTICNRKAAQGGASGGSTGWPHSRCVLKAQFIQYFEGLDIGFKKEESRKTLKFLAKSAFRVWPKAWTHIRCQTLEKEKKTRNLAHRSNTD